MTASGGTDRGVGGRSLIAGAHGPMVRTACDGLGNLGTPLLKEVPAWSDTPMVTSPTGPDGAARRRVRGRRRGDRGAALVEGALVAPLFFLLILILLEFGLVFRQYLTLTSAVRSTARTASTGGNDGNADYLALQQLKSSVVAIQTSEIKFIVIYNAPTVESTPENDASLAGCLTSSQTNKCNRYLASDLSLGPSSFGCGASAPDRFWCPTDRNVALTDPPDYVGIYMKTSYTTFTGVFPNPFALTDSAVFRIEPRQR